MSDEATDDLNGAVARFSALLPGWWFTVGRCDLTCHSTVGPDRAHIPAPYLNKYDRGFSADIANPTTCAAALNEAVRKAIEMLTAEGDYQHAILPSKELSDG